MDSIKNKLHFEKREGGIRNQVSGVFSRGKSSSGPSYNPRPITELRDPASYGPPPRRSVAAPPPILPSRHDGIEDTTPSPRYSSPTSGSSSIKPPPPLPPTSTQRPAPALPPRLPPRTTGSPTTTSSSSPILPPPAPTQVSASATTPSGSSLLNQGAISRLGAAGISVPGFGIGTKPSPPSSHPSPPPPAPQAPSEGTTWAQKKAALNTASKFHKDPSSVSLSDARSAASTMNNFRQRHGDQVAAGARTANGLNQRYGIAERVGGVAGAGTQVERGGRGDGTAGVGAEHASPLMVASRLIAGSGSGSGSGLGTVGKKAPPPPPPPKRAGAVLPPPVPSRTRPSF